MSELVIKTNNVPRDVLSAFDLTDKERKEFDYLDLDEGEGSFVRYKGWTYDLGNFMRCPEPREANNTHANNLASWDGYCSDSYFSGVCLRWSDDYEQVVMGRYCC